MSSFADQHHDRSFAALFEAFYEIQTPKIQERLNAWMLVTAAAIRKGVPMTTDTALEQAQALLWAFATKDMKQFLAVLKG